MENKFAEVASRSFDTMSVPGLSKKARESLNAAFDAMSRWRVDIANHSERSCNEVIEKMTTAASELGWPEQVVDAARAQMQGITQMQIKTMDQMMDAWEEQLRLPDPATASPATMLSKLKSMQAFGFGTKGSDPFQLGSMNPIQFWMQFAEPWQKFSQEMMSFWAKAAKSQSNIPRSH